MNKQKHCCYYFTSKQDFKFIMKTCGVHKIIFDQMKKIINNKKQNDFQKH